MRGRCTTCSPSVSIRHEHVLVGEDLAVLRLPVLHHVRDGQVAVVIDPIDELLGEVHLEPARVQLLDVHVVLVVVHGGDADGLGPDAEVGVHGDEDTRGVRLRLHDLQRGGQNRVVHHCRVGVARRQLALGERYPQRAAGRQRHALHDGAFQPEVVQLTSHLARVAPQLTQVLLEVVELFDAVDGDDDAVVCEAVHGGGVVQQDIGVENEVLAQSRLPWAVEAV
jgi:hypothetical protein